MKQTSSNTKETLESLNVAVASWDVFKMQSAPNELAALYQQSTSAWHMISDRFREDHTDGSDFWASQIPFLSDGPKDHAQSRSARKCFQPEQTPEQRIVDVMRSACPEILMVRSMVEHSLIVYPSLLPDHTFLRQQLSCAIIRLQQGHHVAVHGRSQHSPEVVLAAAGRWAVMCIHA